MRGGGGGGTGGRKPGSNGGGKSTGGGKRGREAGCPREAVAGRNGKDFATLAQYFAIGQKSTQRREPLPREAGTATEGGGNRECSVREAESSDPPVPHQYRLSSH